MSEIDRIKASYAARNMDPSIKRMYADPIFIHYLTTEREKIYGDKIRRQFGDPGKLKLMEIGAGGGGNLHYFKSIGFLPQNLYANELLEDRIETLRKEHPDIHLLPGDASELQFKNEFDIVFQSTVFTSILDESFRRNLANKMWEMLKPGGIILWYDFVYSNPTSSMVKKATRQDVRRLFPLAKSIRFTPVTLAPPIARRVGNLYPIVNTLFPFLRTHIVGVIEKDN